MLSRPWPWISVSPSSSARIATGNALRVLLSGRSIRYKPALSSRMLSRREGGYPSSSVACGRKPGPPSISTGFTTNSKYVLVVGIQKCVRSNSQPKFYSTCSCILSLGILAALLKRYSLHKTMTQVIHKKIICRRSRPLGGTIRRVQDGSGEDCRVVSALLLFSQVIGIL